MNQSVAVKKLKYFILKYRRDLTSYIAAIILYILAFVYIGEPKTLLIFSIILTLLVLWITIFLRAKNRDFFYLSLTSRRDSDNWFGSGVFKYDRINKCHYITESEPGYIYSKTLMWDDYTLDFDFKIITTCIGVIVRAVNLSDYIMLQLRLDEVRPHIRINGGWKAYEVKETNLNIDPELSLDKWYHCLVACEKDIVQIKIVDSSDVILLEKQWTIPRGSILFRYTHNNSTNKPKQVTTSEIPFHVNSEYGAIGFRNSSSEKALIKNILVKKI